MNYRKFEALFISLGLSVILATILASYLNQADYVEIIGQAMFGPVLFFALHYGRKAGFLAALVSALLFIVAKFYIQDEAMSTFIPEVILARAAIFGLVGIVGGELAHRMKYMILKFGNEDLLDAQTNVYNKAYSIQIIQKNIENHGRYQREFSLALVDISNKQSIFIDDLSRKKIMENLAFSLKENVRLVDDVGRWDDDRFCIIFPETKTNEAQIAIARIGKLLKSKLNDLLKKVDVTLELNTELLTFPAEKERILDMAGLDENDVTPENFGARLGEQAIQGE